MSRSWWTAPLYGACLCKSDRVGKSFHSIVVLLVFWSPAFDIRRWLQPRRQSELLHVQINTQHEDLQILLFWHVERFLVLRVY